MKFQTFFFYLKIGRIFERTSWEPLERFIENEYEIIRGRFPIKVHESSEILQKI